MAQGKACDKVAHGAESYDNMLAAIVSYTNQDLNREDTSQNTL
jgi:hypothetical protein